MTAVPRPPPGVMDGKVHWFPLRIYYEETDAGHMVHHAAYLKFAERARTEMMRINGLDHMSLMKTDRLVFTVHSADIRYLRPAKLDDELVVRTQVAGMGGASLNMSQRVHRIDDGQLGHAIAELDLWLAIVDEAGKPQRLPPRLKNALEQLRDKKG
jgi:acyl-CoA thioester hydrolase